jgi:3-oxoadipate enol-lactonase/4-carboxymuconolactone decarboxylase
VTVTVTAVELAGTPDRPLLVVGPSIGTTAELLWSEVAGRLGDAFHVVGWDLPGHGTNAAVPAAPYDAAELARAVLTVADRHGAETFFYAGDSIGGVVGQQLLLDVPERVRAAALVCTSPRFGDPATWHERITLVREQGTEAVVDGSRKRWFPDSFALRHPDVVHRLLQSLRDADDAGYASCCGVLASFDSRDRLGEITAPVLAIAGTEDLAAPLDGMRLIADSVQHGRLVALDGVGHQAPAEAPDVVADLLREHFSPAPAPGALDGMTVRREVLGDAHVDRAAAGATDLTLEFQSFSTDYAWGGIWTRPGLDRRSRSMITLTALIARGHHEELALHVRAALRNGLTRDELKEVLLQSAIYCGVPDANTAFRIAQQVLDDLDRPDHEENP